MRCLSSKPHPYGTKWMMLIENPQDERYKGDILCSMIRGDEDEAPESVCVFVGFTIDQVMSELEETCGRDRTNWTQIADQVPGCLDEWIAPVRVARTKERNEIPGVWEMLVDGQWKSHIPKSRLRLESENLGL